MMPSCRKLLGVLHGLVPRGVAARESRLGVGGVNGEITPYSPTLRQAASIACDTVGSLEKSVAASCRVRFAKPAIFRFGLGGNPVSA